MKTLTLQQGSDAWLAHRRTTRNASDAPAMMGVSPYVTRAELVRRAATGVEREVDQATQARFDRGHAVEPALRALAEEHLGEDLYPVVAVSDDGYLGASFDGVNLGGDVILEAKQSNAEKMAAMQRGEIPPADLWQIVQQFAVCETAQVCLYLVGDGTEEGTSRLDIQRAEVEGLIPQLLAGWRQFDADVAAYVPEPAAAPAAVGRAPDALPTLSVIARGMVEHSNHREFRERALAAIQAVNRDLQTDDDFATAELTVKAFKAGEDMLEATRQQILGQMADVNDVMTTIDEVQAELRRVRLDLDKLVSKEKERRKGELVQAAADDVRAHYDAINATLGQHRILPPQSLMLDLGSAIKGKKSLASMKDALSTAAAQIKVAASQQAERVRACAAIIAEHPDHAALFPDRVQLCAAKQPEDLRNLVAARIAEHQQRIEAERERIRQEEVDRLERERQAEAQRQEQEHAPQADLGTTVHQQQPVEIRRDSPPAGAVSAPPGTSSARVRLGDINATIAPLSITSDGLAMLGIRPIATERSSKLYAAADLPRIYGALGRVIQQAANRSQHQEAA